MSPLGHEITILKESFEELQESLIYLDSAIASRQVDALTPVWNAFSDTKGQSEDVVIISMVESLRGVPSWTDTSDTARNALAQTLYGLYTAMTLLREVNGIVNDTVQTYREEDDLSRSNRA
jgi:hypothetical protein